MSVPATLLATLVEKIGARAGGFPALRPGQLVTAKVDFACAHGACGPRRWGPELKAMGASLWKLSKIAIVSDPYVPAVDAESASILKRRSRHASWP